MKFSVDRGRLYDRLDKDGRADFEAQPQNLRVPEWPVSGAMRPDNISVTVMAYKRTLSVTGAIIELSAFYEGHGAHSMVQYYTDDMNFWTEVARVVGLAYSRWEQANAVESDEIPEHTN